MKFKIVRSKFLDGLKKVQNIVGAKGSMLIIQNVLIEAKEKELILLLIQNLVNRFSVATLRSYHVFIIFSIKNQLISRDSHKLWRPCCE